MGRFLAFPLSLRSAEKLAIRPTGTECFGWALEETLESYTPRLRPVPEGCRHHHGDKKSWIKQDAATAAPPRGEAAAAASGHVDRRVDASKRRWSWWPTWDELATHYLREIGFLACLAQMIGATVFWISGFTALKPITAALSAPASNGVYWLPQVVGGAGFIVSSLLLMIEVQDKWYRPALGSLGWHIGFWNFVGAIGFTLCGALGFGVENGESIQYALTLATFVGSWAFLVRDHVSITRRIFTNSPPSLAR